MIEINTMEKVGMAALPLAVLVTEAVGIDVPDAELAGVDVGIVVLTPAFGPVAPALVMTYISPVESEEKYSRP